MRLKDVVCAVAALGCAWSARAADTKAAPAAPGAAILQELRSFNTVATVLHIAAHPDDENTALITYLARGRGYRTGYLSLTRGDGGQNEIGSEFDEKLGIARTQELIAARRLDRGRQFFTRAIDFGFSKTPEETLAFWDKKEVLGDVVRIIRQFRPDVLVTRFPVPPGSGGHGHHTASAILAVEAFKLAGDPAAYPEQLTQGLTVWQPKRVWWNGFGAGRGGGGAITGPTVRIDIGGTDPVTGEGFGAIASRSRGMHITQFGISSGRGGGGGGGPNEQSFTLMGGEPAEKDILDGVDTTWARVGGGAEIGQLAADAIAQFKAADPAASVPALLVIRKKLRALGAAPASLSGSSPAAASPPPSSLPLGPVLNDKLVQLDGIIRDCLGLTVRTTAPVAEVVPGETIKLRATVSLASSAVPVVWTGVTTKQSATEVGRALRAGAAENLDMDQPVPRDAAPTQPYWLREDSRAGIARVLDPTMIGLPENPPAVPIGYRFSVGGESILVEDEPLFLASGDSRERPRRLDVIPPVSLGFAADVSVFAPGSTRPVAVHLLAARPGAAGALQLELPEGWKAVPARHAFTLAAVGEKATFVFEVTAPAQPTSGRIGAWAEIKGAGYHTQRIEINYPHLPFILLQPPAKARLVSLEVQTRGRKVGYLPGAGDATAEALKQLGYEVTTLGAADLSAEKLGALDAVVIGVRAFNQRDDLRTSLPGLFTYVENGGTVIAQYNRPNGLVTETLGPYALSIAGSAPQLRVTDEKAPVTFLAPNHAALNQPNRIGPADFEGWVQERGAYFPSRWDEQHYTAILSMSDPGEPPLKSSLLVARHGKGYYVYTGIAFFRQLPAGVPGAYRLLANLVSLGK